MAKHTADRRLYRNKLDGLEVRQLDSQARNKDSNPLKRRNHRRKGIEDLAPLPVLEKGCLDADLPSRAPLGPKLVSVTPQLA